MILVPVGQNNSDDVVEPVTKIAEIGQNHVDARLVLFGEQHSAVNNEQLAVDLKDGHVATNLADAAERDYAQNAWA